MKKILTAFVVSLFFCGTIFSQLDDRFSALTSQNIAGYAQPFATTLGLTMNSGGYKSADIPSVFGFSFSIRAMYIFIPDEQTMYTPVLPDGYTANEQTATIWGNKGNSYAGPAGYIVMPPGIDLTSVPAGYPQISVSFLGTEVMLRYLPKIPIAEKDLSMFGVGVAHSISRYIPLLPVKIAAQVMYNTLEITDLMKIKNIAFNVHASKSFGIFSPYVGLQYESTSFDLNYTYKGDPNSQIPELQNDQQISVSLDGENTVRATFGAALKLAFLVINADYNFANQSLATAGITFEF